MSDPLGQVMTAFLAPERTSVWDRLVGEAEYATGQGARHPPGSQPPIKLSVVSLVIDVTIAARETADDLLRRQAATVPGNLWMIHDVLTRRPDPDLTDWWTEAVQGWTHRAETILAPNLMRWLYGAACPYCGQAFASAHQDGELIRLPAIGITWDQPRAEEYQVRLVDCRACGAQWERDENLSDLVTAMIQINREFETLDLR